MSKLLILAIFALTGAALLGACSREAVTSTGSCVRQCLANPTPTSPTVARQLEK